MSMNRIINSAKSFAGDLKKQIKIAGHYLGVAGLIPRIAHSHLQYRNVHLERAELGRAIVRFFRALLEPFLQGRKLLKLTSTKKGRELLVDMIVKSVQNHAKNLKPEDIEKLRDELHKIAEDPNLKGRKLVNTMLKKVDEFAKSKAAGTAGDTKQAKKEAGNIVSKVHRDVSVWTSRGVMINKEGEILDLVEGKLITKSGETVNLVLDPSKKEEFKNVLETLESHGFNVSPEKYAKMIESKIIVESLMKSDSFKDAVSLITENIEKRLESDELFRAGYRELMKNETLRSYNSAALFAAFQELFVKLPLQLSATVNRMLANSVRRLPIVGDIAAVQYEAGAAMAEIGDKLSDRVESAANMWFTLSGNLAGSDAVKLWVAKNVEESMKRTQQTQTPATTATL